MQSICIERVEVPELAEGLIKFHLINFCSRGVAWFNTLPCHGRDHGFKSRRLRHVGFVEPNLSRRNLGTGGSSAFLFTLIPKFLVWGFIYAYFDRLATWGLALLRGSNAPVYCFNNNIICGIILLTIE